MSYTVSSSVRQIELRIVGFVEMVLGSPVVVVGGSKMLNDGIDVCLPLRVGRVDAVRNGVSNVNNCKKSYFFLLQGGSSSDSTY